MLNDVHQILILLIFIHVALCSYYYLLYQDNKKIKAEDELLLKLEEKFSDNNTERCDTLTKRELPVVCNGFHDKFFKDNNKFLGWRYFYLKNQSKDQVPEDTNFKGTSVRKYLDNLENVKNEVTPLQYQIR